MKYVLLLVDIWLELGSNSFCSLGWQFVYNIISVELKLQKKEKRDQIRGEMSNFDFYKIQIILQSISKFNSFTYFKYYFVIDVFGFSFQ